MLSDAPRTGYVVKVYPRFSETFVVTEILAREAQGEHLEIFSLRPTDDTRFHSELARVTAPVRAIAPPRRVAPLWQVLRDAAADPFLAAAIGRHLGDLVSSEASDAIQAIEIARQVRARGITHLHAHFASTATSVARLAARLSGISYSFTAHAKDVFHDSVSADDLDMKLRDAAFAVTVSDFNLRHLRETFPRRDRLHRVYNGLELSRFPFVTRAPGDELRMLSVGRLVEKKGFGVLIDAFDRVRDAGIAARLDIVGDGELRDDIAARIARSPHRHGIRLRGPLPQDEVARCLAEADLFVAPCLVGGDGNVDGLPTVLLEAMASGVPCISTAVTGIPEVIRHHETGLLCEPGDVVGLSEAIMAVARPGFDRVGIARRARALVENEFDAARQAARLAALTAEASFATERKAA